MCVWTHVCQSIHVEVRGQFVSFVFSQLLSHLTGQAFHILEKEIKYCFCFFLKLWVLSLFFIVMLSLYFWMSVKQCITLCFVFEISNVILYIAVLRKFLLWYCFWEMSIYMFIYIHMHTDIHRHAHNCLIVFCVEARCQRWMLFFRFHLLFFFFRWGIFTGIQTFRIRLGLWDSESQRSYCLYLFKTGITCAHYCPWLLHGYWGSNSVFSCVHV